MWAHILPDTVAVLSLGLLVEELRFSYIWNAGKPPILRNGNTTVRCHPTNNVPFICPGVSSEAGDVSKASGDREQWEQVGTEDEPPELCEIKESDIGKTGKESSQRREQEGTKKGQATTRPDAAHGCAPTLRDSMRWFSFSAESRARATRRARRASFSAAGAGSIMARARVRRLAMVAMWPRTRSDSTSCRQQAQRGQGQAGQHIMPKAAESNEQVSLHAQQQCRAGPRQAAGNLTCPPKCTVLFLWSKRAWK